MSGPVRLGRASALALALVAFTALPAGAAEVHAEIDAGADDVTIERGSTGTLAIAVTASGDLSCFSTPARPSTARFKLNYVVTDAGTVASGGVASQLLSFWATGDCTVTWSGAPDPQTVSISIAVDPAAPSGTYALALTPTLSSPASPGLTDAEPTVVTIAVPGGDAAPPSVSCGPPVGNAGANGWFTSAVRHECSASDDVGLADPSDASFTLATAGEGAVMTGARAVSDLAGNTVDAGPFGPYAVDASNPTVTFGRQVEGGSVTVGSDVTIEYACWDAVSGIATCAGSQPSGSALDTSTAGERAVTVTATDVAGRSTTETLRVAVVYQTDGPTVASGPAHPKAGSTVQLSWSLGGVGDTATMTAATTASCDGGPSSPLESPGKSGLTYDQQSDTYKLLWQTSKGMAGSCVRVALSLDDGTTQTLDVWFA
ncbi:MAG TPA: PxKF domain-containing protein [Actinomycetota bacterium]